MKTYLGLWKTHGEKSCTPVISVTTRHEIEPLRHHWILPKIGDLVRVCGERDGLPLPYYDWPSKVIDKQGGVPRRGKAKKLLKPALVEFKVEASSYWFAWFQLEPWNEKTMKLSPGPAKTKPTDPRLEGVQQASMQDISGCSLTCYNQGSKVPGRSVNCPRRDTRNVRFPVHRESTPSIAAPETWRAVPGFEGLYEVSDLGRVRALRVRFGVCDRLRPEPLILKWRLSCGYATVTINHRTMRVHRLVLLAFVGPCPEGMEASHINGHRSDNRPVNLRWESHADNMARKVGHGTVARGDRTGIRLHPERYPRGDDSFPRMHPERLARGDRHGSQTHPERVARGERAGLVKLTAEQITAIRLASANGATQEFLAALHGVNQTTISRIIRRRTWTHLP